MALRSLEKKVLEPLISKHGRSFASLAGWSMPSSRNLWDILKREQIDGHDERHVRDIWLEVSSFICLRQKELHRPETAGMHCHKAEADKPLYLYCSTMLILQRAAYLLCSHQLNILVS